MEERKNVLFNQKLIAFLFLVNEETEKLEIDDIILRKVSDKEKKIFFEHHHEGMHKDVVTHCLEFNINEDFIEYVKTSTAKEPIYSDKNWDKDITEDDKEILIFRKAIWFMEKLIQSINISVQEPVCISRIDAFSNQDYIKTVQYYDIKYFNWDNGCYIKEKDIPIIHYLYSTLLDADKGLYKTDYKKNWWIIAVDYFGRYAESEFMADQLIDIMIGMESLLSGPNENMEIAYRLRLRASLYLYYLVNWDPKQIQELINGLYKVRSKIVHGNATLGKTEQLNIKIDGKNIFLYDSLAMLREIMRIMLLDTILTHATKTKEEFISFIDTIWQNKDETDLIKFNT